MARPGAVKLALTLPDFKGLAEKITKRVDDGMKPVIKDAAQKVLATAKDLVPVDEGDLKESLGVNVGERSAIIFSDASKAPHGFLVHFGSEHNVGNQFLYRASDQHKADFLKGAKEGFDKGLSG